MVLHNHGDQPYTIMQDQQIAQMLIYSIAQPATKLVKELTTTERDQNGFGSTRQCTVPKVCAITMTVSPIQTILQADGIKP